jgi:hypothetical protein
MTLSPVKLGLARLPTFQVEHDHPLSAGRKTS